MWARMQNDIEARVVGLQVASEQAINHLEYRLLAVPMAFAKCQISIDTVVCEPQSSDCVNGRRELLDNPHVWCR